MGALHSANRRRWRSLNRPALNGLIVQAIEFRGEAFHTYLYTIRGGREVRHEPKPRPVQPDAEPTDVDAEGGIISAQEDGHE